MNFKPPHHNKDFHQPQQGLMVGELVSPIHISLFGCKGKSNKWIKEKKKEWEKNADFWIKIIREKLDPFREVVTNRAILESLNPAKDSKNNEKVQKEYISNGAKSSENLKILDAGCGEGYLCRKLANKGHFLYGIDFSEKLIKSAQDLEKKNQLGIKYSMGDFRKTNFPPSFFDIILSHQTINEIDNPEKAFKEFFRILKNKGKLVCLFLHPCFDAGPERINPLNYFGRKRIEKKCYSAGGIKSPSPYFYLHLPLSEWISILTKSGFLISNIKEPCPPLKFLRKKWWKENFSYPRFILIEANKI